MDPQNLKDMAGRLQRGGRGAGIGGAMLAAAGGIAYGLYNSFYTGKKFYENFTWAIINVNMM